MKFYLNQKSLPIIKRCLNCKFYNQQTLSCSSPKVSSAYDYEKFIPIKVSDNQYCKDHVFYNEDVLKKNAVVVEFDSIQDAMDVINQSRHVKDMRRHTESDF